MDIASLYNVSSGAVREAAKQTGAAKRAEAENNGKDLFSTMLHDAIDNLHTTNSYISDMENEELLTSPEEETAGTAGITDGVPEVSEAPQQTESLTLAVEDYNMIAVKSIPIGALSGAIFMIIGFAYLGIVHIFKKV